MGKLITREELKGSLRHYWRMRKWARTQDPEHFVDIDLMDEKLEECWCSEYCSLCVNYRSGKWSGQIYIRRCEDCPLQLAGFKCEEDDAPWHIMASSMKWKEWIVNATKMAQVIADLPRETET